MSLKTEYKGIHYNPVSIAIGGFLLLFFGAVSLYASVPVLGYRMSEWYAAPLMLCVIYAYTKLLSGFEKNFWIHLAIFIMAFILRLIWVAQVPSVPVSDFKFSFDFAQRALDGDFEWTGIKQYALYFYHSWFLSLYGRVFGLSLLSIGILNAVTHALIANMLFSIVTALSGKKAGLYAACMFTFFTHQILYNSVVSNQIMSACFTFSAMLLLIKALNIQSVKTGCATGVASGICFALSVLIRSDTAVCLYSVIVFFLLQLFTYIWGWKKRGEDSLKAVTARLLPMAALIASFFIFCGVLGFAVEKGNIYHFGRNNAYSLFFQMGIGQRIETTGTSLPEDGAAFTELSYDELRERYSEVIRENVGKPGFISMHIRKFSQVWTNKYVHWAFRDSRYEIQNSVFAGWLTAAGDWQYLLFSFLAVFSAFNIAKRRLSDTVNYFAVALFGYFAMLVLMINNSRYKYLAQILIILFAAIGLDILIKFFKKPATARHRSGKRSRK